MEKQCNNKDKTIIEKPIKQAYSKNSREKLDLPFMKRNEDWGSWAYDHRIGLFATLIFTLAATMFIISIRVSLDDVSAFTGMIVDMAEKPEPVKPETELEKKVIQEIGAPDMSDVKNMKINQGAELDAGLKDAKNNNADDIYREAQELQDRMNASRGNYEQGLKDEATILNANASHRGQSDKSAKESRVKGKVTVSYFLEGRRATYLHVPAYTCRGGGEVEVEITVNRRGEVIGASVNKSSSTSDQCLLEMAVKAAKSSRFNVDPSAKEKQTGSISYVFIAQ